MCHGNSSDRLPCSVQRLSHRFNFEGGDGLGATWEGWVVLGHSFACCCCADASLPAGAFAAILGRRASLAFLNSCWEKLAIYQMMLVCLL